MRAVPSPDLDGPPGGPAGLASPGLAQQAEQESALVARVLAGDHEALGPLVAPYVGSVRRVTRAILGDVDDADDAAQDALLLALVKLDQFDRSRRFGPWLMRIVTNAAIDRRRRRRVRLAGGLDDELADDDPLPDAEAERVVLGERLAAAPEQLPERYRAARNA